MPWPLEGAKGSSHDRRAFALGPAFLFLASVLDFTHPFLFLPAAGQVRVSIFRLFSFYFYIHYYYTEVI